LKKIVSETTVIQVKTMLKFEVMPSRCSVDKICACVKSHLQIKKKLNNDYANIKIGLKFLCA